MQSYKIDRKVVAKALQCLKDNGIERDECTTVLQALCYILMDKEIEPLFVEEDFDSGDFDFTEKSELSNSSSTEDSKLHYDEGTCCKCGGEDLEYGTIEIADDSIYYPFTCNECGAQGKEWYDLSYAGTEME